MNIKEIILKKKTMNGSKILCKNIIGTYDCVQKLISWVDANGVPIDVPIVMWLHLHFTFKTNNNPIKYY